MSANGDSTKLSLPWDPDSTVFPTRKHLPQLDNAPPEAAWVWGPEDNIGRLNLLTPARVKSAATSSILTGEIVPLNLPLDMPKRPEFGREKFVHEIKPLVENYAYDDIYHLNTQSGTQWDGFRHFAHTASVKFYNGATGRDVMGPDKNLRCSIHHWAEHGIAGRGILLDYRRYADEHGIRYSSYERHSISYGELKKCGEWQGIDIRPEEQGGDIKVGDMLFIRSGFVRENTAMSKNPAPAEPKAKPEFAGVMQSQEVLDWLHDCYFATVAGDAPSFEAWPTKERKLSHVHNETPTVEVANLALYAAFYLHEYILALWGMPLGEMLDLERLSEKCEQMGRYTFFFTSSPANVHGGVSSHVNGQAIF
jgi:hypothetical protein